jgi:CheY-like chemotaxis protein
MGPVGASYEGEAPSLSEAKKKIGKFKSEKDLCTVCGKKGKIVQGGSWAGAICKKCADEGYHMDPMGTIHAPGSKPWKAYESRLNMLGSAFGRARKFMLESKSILVVDNDKDMAEIAADVIGGNTTVVTDPAKAIKMIKDKKFDIIVTDWNMGRLSGDDVFDAAKDTGAKLVLMSSEPERSRNRNSFDLVITKGERDMLAKFKKVSSL